METIRIPLPPELVQRLAGRSATQARMALKGTDTLLRGGDRQLGGAAQGQLCTAGHMMKIHFDEETDALYIRLDDAKIVASEEVKPGIVLDFDAQDRVVAIEILRSREHASLANLKQIQFEVAP